MVSLQEFLDKVARSTAPPPLAGGKPSSVTDVTRANPRFVEPPLREEKAITPGASVVLLQAPAAVGKSTLAAEIARRQGASLWNLAEPGFYVASGTFQGTLAAAYGPGQLATVNALLDSGQLLVVLDALDEAEVR